MIGWECWAGWMEGSGVFGCGDFVWEVSLGRDAVDTGSRCGGFVMGWLVAVYLG